MTEAQKHWADRWKAVRETSQGLLSVLAILSLVWGGVAGFWQDIYATWSDLAELPAKVAGLEVASAVQAEAAKTNAAETAALRAEIAALRPPTRVIAEGENLPYVQKPVHLGEPILLVLYIGRTEVGAACILKSSTPIFVDAFGVTRAGETSAPREQLGSEIVRREIELDLPPGLGPGTSSVRLQLEYQCGTEPPIYESTRPVLFDIQPARTGQ
jgi:hypothetical protein